MTSLIGGRYSLDHEIGRGGMGAVWLGSDRVLGRPVAMKQVGVIPGGSSPDVIRAEREGRLAAQLNHPHVVGVFDLVAEGDQHWLVMEHVEGTDLAELVRASGSLTPDQIAPLLAQAADALAAAHGAGIVHRDVKPSNILVTPDGAVKLTDFGIARAEADAALTQTGLVTGSPAYLSPEVASGQPASPASDVWSLGATVFHALTGQPPYEVGDNVLGTLYRIVHDEPPRPAHPGWLGPMLDGTMTHDPADRWTAAEVRDFLRSGGSATVLAAVSSGAATAETAMGGDQATRLLPTGPVTRPVGGPPPAPPGERRTPWGLVGLAAVVVLLISAIAFAVGLQGRDGGNGATGTETPTTSSAPSQPEPTAEGMEAFVSTYLDTVVEDPEAAFAMLTPEFQQASGGYDSYVGFWGDVNETRLEEISADPSSLTVEYTYKYSRKGEGSAEDDVTLQLQYTDGTYLIAGES